MALFDKKDILGSAAGAAGKFAGKAVKAGKEAASTAAGKAAEVGASAASAATEGAKAAMQKTQELNQEMKLRHFSPVMREEYEAEGFDTPNIVKIVDEDARKGVDVCEGAIGWLTRHNGTEVLHLYSEYVDSSGLVFHPTPSIGAVYLTDKFNEGRFVDTACYLEIAQSDKLTELKQIAHKLGAKECRLSSLESERSSVSASGKLKGKAQDRTPKIGSKGTADAGANFGSSDKTTRKIEFEQHFEGDAAPVRPDLRWYAHDREILSLIEARMDPSLNATSEYHINLDCATTSTMSLDLAATLDSVMGKISRGGSLGFKSKVESEMRRQLDFYVRF